MEMVGNLYRVNQTPESLERLFTDTIMEIMRVQWIGFFACGEQQGEFTLECTKPIVKEWKEASVSLTQEQVGRVEKEQTAVVLPASENSTYCSVSQVISSRLGDQKISLMLPLFDAGTTLKEHRKGSRLKGFVLLGERELKQPYSSVELHYLKLAAKQFRQALQIAEAKLELQQAHDDLERRVEERTEALSIANQDLERTNRELDAILLNLPAGVAILEGSELRYFRINQKLADLNGMPIEEHLVRPLAEVLPDAAQELLPVMRKIVETGEGVFGREFSIGLPKAPDTKVHLINYLFPVIGEDGKAGSVGTIVLDISERKRAEEKLKVLNETLEQRVASGTEELRASKRLNENIVASVPAGLLVMRGPKRSGKYRVVSVNRSFCEIFGVKAAETVGKPADEVLSGIGMSASDRSALLVGHSAQELECECSSRAIGTMALHLSMTSIRIAQEEEEEEVLLVMENITEHKRLESQLLQSQKMEAVGRLAGGVAHDFNNVLMAMNTYGELVLQSLPEDAPARQYAVEIMKCGGRAGKITQQLLAFGRKQVLEAKEIDLNSVMSDMHKLLRPLIGEDIRLVTVPKDDLWEVWADRHQIEQIVVNLGINARDAMPNGGTLTVEIENEEIQEHYQGQDPDISPGSYVTLSVTDTGIGMDKATMAKIFEPFFTTKGVGKGSGLGLSVVHGIVKQSGGHITVYSELGRGTTFKIRLPRLVKKVKERSEKQEEKELPGGSETILLVEDESSVRVPTRELLKQHGYTVLDASRGSEALDIAGEQQRPIDLLLTDVVMPGMGGKDVADQLKRLRPSVKVLFMSGYTEQAIVQNGVFDPGTAFVHKPVSARALLVKIRELLESTQRRERKDEVRAKARRGR